MSVPKNMTELKAYVANKRRLEAQESNRKRLADGFCSGLTDKEYMRVHISGKKSYTKARKFTHNKMWRETHKKFDTQQLKLIKR